MQTKEWMAYSDSSHFYDQFSYRKHFILSYTLKDIDFPSFSKFLQFSENRKRPGTFLTEGEDSLGHGRTGPDAADMDADWSRWARTFLTDKKPAPEADGWGPAVMEQRIK
jgi:hypothetical protein